MKLQTPTLQNKANSQSGGLNRVLFSPLKENPTEPAIKRVDRVLSLLVVAEAHRNDWNNFTTRALESRITQFLALQHNSKESEFAYHSSLDLLNAALRRYRWRAEVSGNIDGFRSELHPQVEVSSKNSWANWEPFVVAMLLERTKIPGEISRFRLCSECQQWFYAIRGHQQFCGETCRRRHEAQDPTFKEKRRMYMRERYRPLQKELQDRSLALAKAPRRTKRKG
jgi:hypothetical protein